MEIFAEKIGFLWFFVNCANFAVRNWRLVIVRNDAPSHNNHVRSTPANIANLSISKERLLRPLYWQVTIFKICLNLSIRIFIANAHSKIKIILFFNFLAMRKTVPTKIVFLYVFLSIQSAKNLIILNSAKNCESIFIVFYCF